MLDTQAPVWRGWLAGLADHKATTAMWKYDATKPQLLNPIAFDGLGLGWLFLEAFRTTEKTFLNYSCPFYVVEGEPVSLAMVLHMHDFQEVLASPRLRLFIGATGEEALSKFRVELTENARWTLPEVVIRCFLRSQTPLDVEGVVKGVRALRQTQRDRHTAEANAYYAGKDAAYWRGRFASAVGGDTATEPLRVLGITSRYTTVLQHSMAELSEAVNTWRGGGRAEMRVAIEADDQSLENPFLEMIATFKPDLIVQISRMRYENPAIPANVPFLCWDQDNLACMRTSGATESLNELTFVAGHGAVYGYEHLNWPRRNVIFTQPVAATLRYSGRVNTSLVNKYTCDVSFVSNASTPPEQVKDQQRNNWVHHAEAALVVIFDLVSEEVIAGMEKSGGWEFTRLREAVLSTGHQRGILLTGAMADEITLSIMPIADRCFRHAALRWVKRWCDANGKILRLYGKGWDREPAFAPYAAGTAEQGEELMTIYQASRINLQLIESGFLHSRALDGMAAGGFFLTRRAFNDGDLAGVAAAHHRLGVVAEKIGLQTLRSLDESADPEVVANWKVVKQWYRNQPRSMELKTMGIWAATPGAAIVFEDYWDISFESEADFGSLAARYLGDDTLRNEIAARMQARVRAKFSYCAIWEYFLSNVSSSLNKEVTINGG